MIHIQLQYAVSLVGRDSSPPFILHLHLTNPLTEINLEIDRAFFFFLSGTEKKEKKPNRSMNYAGILRLSEIEMKTATCHSNGRHVGNLFEAIDWGK